MASLKSSAPAVKQELPPLPNFCNYGFVLRTLSALNGGAALIALSGSGIAQAVDRFFQSALILEPAGLMTLGALCALRPALVRESVVGRRIGIGAVAVLATLITYLIVSFALQSSPQEVAGSSLGLVSAAALSAILALSTVHYFQIRARAFSPAIAASRLQALQSRIRPHFLFNSLNAAMSLVRSDPRRAERMLEDLADLFRVLMRDARHLVRLEDEIALTKQYLAIEEVRLGDRLRVEWETHRLPSDYLVPALLLQPLLENAVHHGIETNEHPGVIKVRITAVARELIVVVENAYDPSLVVGGNQLALQNIRERLALLYDLEARVRASGDGNLYRVSLTLPISGVVSE